MADSTTAEDGAVSDAPDLHGLELILRADTPLARIASLEEPRAIELLAYNALLIELIPNLPGDTQ